MMFAVYNRQCTIVTTTVRHHIQPVQTMCQTQIIKLLYRNHHRNRVFRIVCYRCGIIRPFCIRPIIRCTKHRVQVSMKRRWCGKHRHQCIQIWRYQMDHRHRRHVLNAWRRRHQHHASTAAAATVTQLTYG